VSAYEHPDLIALDQVEDVLEAYAEARLSPSGPLLARIHATVMTQAAGTLAARAAHAAAAAAAEAASSEPPARRWYRLPPPRMDGPRWQAPRFAAALGFAVLLGLGTSAAVTAAAPGSPLYYARVTLEDIFLPTQIDERLAAHEQHLEARLAEAEAAAARGDFVGLDAALAAYRTEVDAAIAEVGEDNDRVAKLLAVLEKHVATLCALAERLPTAVARDEAMEHALQASHKALTNMQDKKDHADIKPPVPPRQDDPPGRPTVAPAPPLNPENRPVEPGR
jgi:hypothetical protein